MLEALGPGVEDCETVVDGRLDSTDEVSESTDDGSCDGDREDGCESADDAAEGRLEASLPCDESLGWDDRLCGLEGADSLDRSCEDGDRLEGSSDEDGCDEADGKDEASLLRMELPLGLDRGDELGRLDNSELDAERTLDCDDRGLEPLDFDERDELRLERLPAELFEERADEALERELRDDRLDESGLLELELRRLLLALLLDEDNDELDTLLTDESLEELSDDRDDSLTLENDLLDP